MEFFVIFFRDFLDGPLYILLVLINSILICSCIGYLGEQYLEKQAAKKALMPSEDGGVNLVDAMPDGQAQMQGDVNPNDPSNLM